MVSPAWRRSLVAAGFLLQGALLSRLEGEPTAAPWLFAALSIPALARWRGFSGFIAASAALGGLGMAAGQWMGAAANHPAVAESSAFAIPWSGLLMLAGCAAACLLVSSPVRGWRSSVLHHALIFAGMLAGMMAPHGLASFERLPAAWSPHLLMVLGMTLGGWLGLRAARGWGRRRLAPADPRGLPPLA